MGDDELGRNEAERWFERYLRAHNFEYEYEPSFDRPIETKPDFRVKHGEVELVCEVKGFEQVPPVERRVAALRGPIAMLSPNETLQPMRSAVREAARNLKPLAGSPWPLVVVLANPRGLKVFLSMDHLIEAMMGTLEITGNFDAARGEIENMGFEYGRDGRLRNDHPYISAVAILREHSLAFEYQSEWLSNWKAGRKRRARGYAGVAAEAVAAHEAWLESDPRARTPDGDVYSLGLMTTGSPDAVPMPEGVFDGPRDSRVPIERVPV